MSDALRTSHLTKVYGAGDLAVRALDDVTLSLPSGRFTSIMGSSGSGKSTFMHVVAGLERATSGTVVIGDLDLSSAGDDALTRMRRDHVGFIFPSFNLLPNYSVRQNVLLPLRLGRRRPEGPWFERIVETLGLGGLLAKTPEQLSGGQQQRAAIARALLGRPEVILADEPTGSLDSATSTEVLELLRICVREFGQTVVMARHDVAAAAFAEQTVLLSDGRVAGKVSNPTTRSILTALEALDVRVGIE